MHSHASVTCVLNSAYVYLDSQPAAPPLPPLVTYPRLKDATASPHASKKDFVDASSLTKGLLLLPSILTNIASVVATGSLPNCLRTMLTVVRHRALNDYGGPSNSQERRSLSHDHSHIVECVLSRNSNICCVLSVGMVCDGVLTCTMGFTCQTASRKYTIDCESQTRHSPRWLLLGLYAEDLSSWPKNATITAAEKALPADYKTVAA